MALIITGIYHVASILLCGLIGGQAVSSWFFITKWINGFRYSFNMLVMNEFRNISFCLSRRPDICPITGLKAMSKIPLDYSSEWDVWKNFFQLTILTIILFLLFYIQFCRVKTTRWRHINIFVYRKSEFTSKSVSMFSPPAIYTIISERLIWSSWNFLHVIVTSI